jgi:hypothetical protein
LIHPAARADVNVMQSIRLTVARTPLIHALQTLSVARRRRFSSSLPVWLHFAAERDELEIAEDRSQVAARVPAKGSWPPLGATVDLFMLRRAASRIETDTIDLHALHDAILIYAGRWQVKLNLLCFGPDSRRRASSSIAEPVRPQAPLALLPLFRWAAGKSPSAS